MNSPYMGKFKVSQQYKGSTHDGLDLVGIDSKEIHSTVNGVVERAGWENSANHSQGFGLYVRIKKDGTNERYYFGHLSQVKVKVGDKVKITQVIGVEGNTGYSTGSHCHYCCRNNANKNEIKIFRLLVAYRIKSVFMPIPKLTKKKILKQRKITK